MTLSLEELRAQAMELPPDEREAFALDLLGSVDLIDDAGADDSVIAVMKERSAALHRGELPTQDWRESIAELRQWITELRANRS